MKIYLVRHGDALNMTEDSQRSLSTQGRQEVQRMARFLGDNQVTVAQIYHSGKLRAQETAKELATGLSALPRIDVLSGLRPDDPVKPIAVYCNHWQEDVMLVGHLPFLSKLAAELLFEQEDKQCTEFQTAAILCLNRIALFQWSIAWFVNPSLIS